MNTRIATLAATLLLASNAMAQEVNVPEREQRRGMSYEEYSSVRENMRLRMEKMREAERKQETMREAQPSAPPRTADGKYGQGYHTRSRPDAATIERPEHAERPQRIERFNRGDMMRR